MEGRGMSLNEQAEAFFNLFPKVVTFGITNPDYLLVTVRGKAGIFTEDGKFVFDEDGKIVGFEAFNGRISLKRPNETIPKDLLTAQISGLLNDSTAASRYCEQISYTLLEEGECLFNAPYGLRMKDKVFEERYSSPEWVTAWKNALSKEFHAKSVEADEAAGIGCFRLQAI